MQKKKEVKYLQGRPKKERKEMLKEPIKTLKDIPQAMPKKRVPFWKWLFPRIW